MSKTTDPRTVNRTPVVATETSCLVPLADVGVDDTWAMVEASPDGMILTDPDGLILVVNSRIEAMFGHDRGDLLGRTVEVLLPEAYRSAHAAHRARYRAEPNMRAMGNGLDLMARRANGSEFRVEVSLSPVTNSHGLRVVATVRDITARLSADHAIQERDAALRTMRERERLARDLHDLVIQRLFAAGMGLQSIGTLIDNEHAAQRVEHTVDELDATINEIRTAIFHLTTRQSGPTNPVGDVVDHSSEYLGFEPTLTIDGNLATVPVEIVDQLVAVVTEGLSNVAHHAHATCVDIALSIDQNRITLIVADNGIGIHPGASHGNGLANLAERARQHSGTVTFTASPSGTGTVVTWTAHA